MPQNALLCPDTPANRSPHLNDKDIYKTYLGKATCRVLTTIGAF